MKRQDFIKAVKLARDPAVEAPGYLSEEMEVFRDCALDKNRRMVSMRQLVGLIRGHCSALDGSWLDSEIAELEALSKRFDVVA